MGNAPSQVGRVLAGRYRLEKRLGVGGMGSIWRAEHLVLCAPVAVKLIDPEIANDAEALDRFIREAQSAAALRSPHVVQILDYGVDQRSPFIVMELLEGENLAQRLARVKRLPPLDTARIVTHVARAIGRAHEAGVIHRDLKPDNIFLVHNEDAEVAKVVDFGVAKVDSSVLASGVTHTRTGSLLGTPYYMSPEQAQGNKDVDYRSDLWALGVIAFECMTGKRPFNSEGLGDLVLQICVRDIPQPSAIASVPPEFDAWFRRAVSRDPEGRFQSAREMADALRAAIGAEAREAIPTLPDPSSPDASAVASVLPRSGVPPGELPTARVNPLPRAEADFARLASLEGRAPTVLAEAAPTPPPPSDSSSMRPALILALAGGAVVVGLVGGLIVLGHDTSGAGDLPAAAVVAGAPTASARSARRNAAGRGERRGSELGAGAARGTQGNAGFDARAWFLNVEAGAARDASSRDASAHDASRARAALADAGTAPQRQRADAGKPRSAAPRPASSLGGIKPGP